jgi:hypothetical protein
MGQHVRRGNSKAGRIPLPPIEILELDERLGGAAISKPASLSPEVGWIRRLLGADGASRFVLEPNQVPAEVLQGRRDFALLEFDPDGRPVLQVLPGMSGELRIGVSRMTVAHMLADPALQQADGSARLPLSNGARLRISCGHKTFLARIGGPPLPEVPQAAGQTQTQLVPA